MGCEPDPMGARPMERAELLRHLAAQLEWPGLEESTALRDDARWDSVAQIDTLMLLQRDVGVSVAADDLQNVRTVRELLDLVDL